MSMMGVNQVDDDEQTGQYDPDKEKQGRQGSGLALTEKGAGWLLFIITLIAFLVTLAVWIWMHEQTWNWAGPAEKHPFANAPWQWIDWIVVSLAGSLLYVLSSIAYWLIQRAAKFKRFTAWYIATVVKAPILALVTLVFLTGVNVEVSGLNIDFTKLEPPILLVVAFVLGFYGSVAREQLNQIVKSLFPKAYGIAEEEFDISPRAAEVVYGNSVQFKTQPLTEVTWQAPSAGKLEDGLYTAPDEAKAGQIVQITAVPKDPNIPRAIARVTLLPFEIKGEDKIVYGASQRYQVAPEPTDGVTWSFSPEVPGAAISDAGVFTAPTKEAALEAKAKGATITARGKTKTEDIATFEVRFSED